MALAMLGHKVDLKDSDAQTWVELLLAAPIVLWAGRPFFVRGVQSIVHRSPNMWTLIGTDVIEVHVESDVVEVITQLA